MTRQEKIEWLRKASNEEVIKAMEFSVAGLVYCESKEMKEGYKEDIDLVKNELMNRLGI